MKKIKVNYTDANTKRTSTTINPQIAWFFFKTTEIYLNGEGDSSSITTCIQDFVNNATVSVGSLSKATIEDLLLHHIVISSFERGANR